jgi:hypothetical protein
VDYVTVKIHADTRRLLRLIAAQTDEQMVQVMQRLCEGEWERIQRSSVPTAPKSTPTMEKARKRRA